MSSPTSAAGQVCDRCRLKKVKCNGATPACKHCAAAGVPCVISARLRRKTKIRGYQPSGEDQVAALQAENEELRRELAAEQATSASLRARMDELLAQSPTGPVASLRGLTSASASASASAATVIKHMGRMVPDGSGGERFSGSTSGVHFILSVQQVLQARCIRAQPFPESCFSLHLLEPHYPQHRLPNLSYSLDSLDSLDSLVALTGLDPEMRAPLSRLMHCFRRPLSFYTHQIHTFLKHWEAFCPIVASTDLCHGLSILLLQPLEPALSPDELQKQTLILFQMCIILLLNAMDPEITESESEVEVESGAQMDKELPLYLSFVHRTVPKLIARADLDSLHGLILFSFYLQVTNQPVVMVQMNGILVRLAQSLGLHRHSRRFKLGVGQIETRKRMWWWIYMFDKLVSVIHGLPKLINDDDVNVDYPLDCDLFQVHASSLSFPLPGETTPVNSFTAHVHLGRIISDTLDDLYTTTRRRRGAEKIANLDGKLQAWRQRWDRQGRQMPSGPEASNASESSTAQEQPEMWDSSNSAGKMRLWSSLLASLTALLIHRPALTFDTSAPQFAESLPVCAEACAGVLSILSSAEGRTCLLGMAPAGPSLILQCGLVEVFCRCHQPETSGSRGGRGGGGGREAKRTKAAKGAKRARDNYTEGPSSGILRQAIDLLASYQNPRLAWLYGGSSGKSGPLDAAFSEIHSLLESLEADLARFEAVQMAQETQEAQGTLETIDTLAESPRPPTTSTTPSSLPWLHGTDLSGLSPFGTGSDEGALPGPSAQPLQHLPQLQHLTQLDQQAPSLSYTPQITTSTPPASFDMLGELGALDYLNHPAAFNWIFQDGNPMAPGPSAE